MVYSNLHVWNVIPRTLVKRADICQLDYTSHPKQFWNQIKRSYHVKQQKQVKPDLFIVNDNLTTDNKEIANGFCRFFAEISKRIKASISSISAVSSIWKYHNITESFQYAKAMFPLFRAIVKLYDYLCKSHLLTDN